MSGTIKIHGKDYKTVALRVNEFRAANPEWGIRTELVDNSDDRVIMKASILNGEYVIGTGYAEERRGSSQINKTSALENCETSAIGRALAACGFGGTEYASANEVENAIHQQNNPKITQDAIREKFVAKAVSEYKRIIDDDNLCKETADEVNFIWRNLNTNEQMEVQDRLGGEKAKDSNRMYRTILKDYQSYHPSQDVPA